MNKFLVVFFLVTPQMSSSLPYVDSYSVLLLTLSVIYGVRQKKMTIHVIYLYLFIYFSVLMLIQYILSDPNHGFFSHTRYLTYRENDTYGFSHQAGTLNIATYIKIILMLAFSQLIYIYLTTLSKKELRNFFLAILLLLSGIQLIFYFLSQINLLDDLLRTFFQQNIRADGSLGGAITIRDGYIRISGGFSEPSMLAIMYFISLYYYYLTTSKNNQAISLPTIVVILLTWGVVMFTTISTSHLSSLVLIILMLFKVKIKNINYIYILFFILLELVIINQSDFVKGVGSSAVVRLLFATDINTLSIEQLLFGTEIANFYSFVPSINLILQLGLFGTITILLILYKHIKSIIHITPVLFVLFVSPRLSDTWIYILLGFILVSQKTQQGQFSENFSKRMQYDVS